VLSFRNKTAEERDISLVFLWEDGYQPMSGRYKTHGIPIDLALIGPPSLPPHRTERVAQPLQRLSSHRIRWSAGIVGVVGALPFIRDHPGKIAPPVLRHRDPAHLLVDRSDNAIDRFGWWGVTYLWDHTGESPLPFALEESLYQLVFIGEVVIDRPNGKPNPPSHLTNREVGRFVEDHSLELVYDALARVGDNFRHLTIFMNNIHNSQAPPLAPPPCDRARSGVPCTHRKRTMYTFGPVPSRRLGQSVGVNNIPPKYCTYACVYCQLGDPQHVSTTRRTFYQPADILAELKETLVAHSDSIDYITVVPDGEPTLDSAIEPLLAGAREEIDRHNQRLPHRPVRLALITNGSLLTHDDVVRGAMLTDWVSVKIDAPDETLWRRIDRPARDLDFTAIRSAITAFRPRYRGIFATETMLVDGLNTDVETLTALATQVNEIAPDVAYLSVPTRPPAESWAVAPEDATILEAYRIFRDAGVPAELNIGHESGDFAVAGDLASGILSIAAVHPIRRDDLQRLVEREEGTWRVVEGLLSAGRLLERTYRNETFYVTRLSHRSGQNGGLPTE
jgi:wyosine [tRNA(Phe)-imidazoG37] synthetase (radical SAM superfamily)